MLAVAFGPGDHPAPPAQQNSSDREDEGRTSVLPEGKVNLIEKGDANLLVLRYKCENDDCPDKDVVRTVKPKQSAECPTCGWFMVAVW